MSSREPNLPESSPPDVPCAAAAAPSSRLNWREVLLLTALAAAALAQRDRIYALSRWIAAASSVCTATAASPTWVNEIGADSIVFLTSEADPLRSEQFFCLQYELLPRVLIRPSLALPSAPLGFGPERPVILYAESPEERARLLSRLESEAGGGSLRVRAETGSWAWLEAATP